jgi:hypothetical protein
MSHHHCPRKECSEVRKTKFGIERHLAEEHDAPWDEYDNYPRAESER